MKYPIALTPSTDGVGYNVLVPDLPGCKTNSLSIDLALEQISEKIKEHLTILTEYSEAIPSATPIANHQTQYPNVIWALIDIDITPYLGRSHKINVTLPELLIKQIDDRVNKSEFYKTRSGFIAQACMTELTK
jgi:predicted RNase H-like HicB family nuclease